jgi:N-acetylglucosamine-6-phosphate deacetylase
MSTVLSASLVCTPSGAAPGWIAIDDGLIVEVGSGRAPKGARDLGTAALAPGYIDLQVNGVGDVDFVDAGAQEWERAGAELLAHGITSYCPTIVSAPLDVYDGALDRVSAARTDAAHDQLPAILGAHIEGPFLGDAPGAHDPELLREADVAWLGALVKRYPGLVRIVTLAPEADPGLSATTMLASAGVVVSLGHSRASYATAIEAADAGASVVTHLFNGMGPLHHREPGLAGAAFTDPRLVPTLIADFVHVHPAVVQLVFAALPDVALVSDAVALSSSVTAQDGAAYLADGTLAGATTTLDRAVANVVSLGVALPRAVAAATAVPAAILRLDDRGQIVPAARADLISLDPVTAEVGDVWIGGEQTTRPTGRT